MSWLHRKDSTADPGRNEDTEAEMQVLRERSEKLSREEQRQIRETRAANSRLEKANESNGWDETWQGLLRSVVVSSKGKHR